MVKSDHVRITEHAEAETVAIAADRENCTCPVMSIFSGELARKLVLLAVSAAAMPFCFEPFGYWPLIPFALAALLAATTGVSSRKAFYMGFAHGFVSFALTLWWMFTIFYAAAVVIYLVFALFTAIFCLLNNYFQRRAVSMSAKILIPATLWTGIEFFRCELFVLRFAWITPGTAIGPTALSPIVGVYGTSFVILLAAACWCQRRMIWPAMTLTAAIVLLGTAGLPRVNLSDAAGNAANKENAEAAAKKFVVGVVQSEQSMIDRYLQLTRSLADQNPQVVVWPEYALPYDVRAFGPDYRRLEELCREMDITLVVGTKTNAATGNSTGSGRAIITSSNGKGKKCGWYNTALTLDKTGTLGDYHKARPVHFFTDGIPGTNFNPVLTGCGAVATPICFDGDFTAIARRLTVNGGEFFAIPSFDATRWTAAQHAQHSALFRLRAAENGRWVAYAASSGVSQIIDPHGNVHASIDVMTEGAITARIAASNELTIFTRIGWIAPWLALAVTALLLGRASTERYYHKHRSTKHLS